MKLVATAPQNARWCALLTLLCSLDFLQAIRQARSLCSAHFSLARPSISLADCGKQQRLERAAQCLSDGESRAGVGPVCMRCAVRTDQSAR